MAKKAKIIKQWVGLRPFRLGGVRLEYEYYKEMTHVIHNYGHGGSGVTLRDPSHITSYLIWKPHVFR